MLAFLHAVGSIPAVLANADVPADAGVPADADVPAVASVPAVAGVPADTGVPAVADVSAVTHSIGLFYHVDEERRFVIVIDIVVLCS